MKRTPRAVIYTTLALHLIFPLGSTAAACFGYVFVLFNYAVFAIVTAAVSLSAVIIALKSGGFAPGIVEKIPLMLLPLLACVNWAFYIFKSDSITAAVCMPVCLICAVILAAALVKPTAPKLTSIIPSLLLAAPLSFITFIWLIFGRIGLNTVVSRVPSPDGAYYAEVIDSDQGALGGDTIVYVHKKGGIDLVIFSIRKAPERVYLGPWGAWRNMSVHWQDEHHLRVGSREYYIE